MKTIKKTKDVKLPTREEYIAECNRKRKWTSAKLGGVVIYSRLSELFDNGPLIKSDDESRYFQKIPDDDINYSTYKHIQFFVEDLATVLQYATSAASNTLEAQITKIEMLKMFQAAHPDTWNNKDIKLGEKIAKAKPSLAEGDPRYDIYNFFVLSAIWRKALEAIAKMTGEDRIKDAIEIPYIKETDDLVTRYNQLATESSKQLGILSEIGYLVPFVPKDDIQKIPLAKMINILWAGASYGTGMNRIINTITKI
ncbi:hypothetical protein PO185_04635 [Limosilactobacillus mucosae]|uniref:hypothetical protein n=1 Tax=Limosilactobacillus mucosae TaxID=97478 RepID=UPI00233EB80B|nr:hypothetical protein [Limosilactobacillus mucosae]MDC2844951.1 hypothetical protein [Limosilactobacillus mucosae]